MTLEAKTGEAVHVMTLRLPEGLYEVIRKRAFDERTSITSQIVVALRDKFESWGLGCDVCGKAHVVITTPGAIRFCAEHAPAPSPPTHEWITAPDGEEFRVGACQGHRDCPVERHEHGCYADDGSNCDHPEDHPESGG